MLSNMTFTFTEILSLLGLVQSVYVIVYMLFRSGSLSNAAIPLMYFLFLGAAFLLDAAAARWRYETASYELLQWFFWSGSVTLGALLAFQIASVSEPLRFKYFLLLLLIPLSFLPTLWIDDPRVLYVSGLVTGAVALLCIWFRRDLLEGLHANPRYGEERFWLVMALIAIGAAILASTLAYVSAWISSANWILIRTLLGIGFVYLAATSLFRIYPQVFKKRSETLPVFTADEQIVLNKLDALLMQEKVYQSASYGRAELARELNVGEAALSRLVNLRYQKTIPQLLNELRVQDAQRLLRETDATIQNIFEESGFNSITTFNRVFKELSGDSPKEYRSRYRL